MATDLLSAELRRLRLIRLLQYGLVVAGSKTLLTLIIYRILSR